MARQRRRRSRAPSLRGTSSARSLASTISHTLLRWSLRASRRVPWHWEHSFGASGVRKMPAGLSLLDTPLCPGCPPLRRAAAPGPSTAGSLPSSMARVIWTTTALNLAAYLLLIDLDDDGVSVPSRYRRRLSPSMTRSTSSSLLAPARSPRAAPASAAAASSLPPASAAAGTGAAGTGAAGTGAAGTGAAGTGAAGTGAAGTGAAGHGRRRRPASGP